VFGLRPFDVWWVLVSAGMLEAVLVLACALPARRACRFHPVECLRADG
jgi:ABC-type lipoprotein release transport system permease subunit